MARALSIGGPKGEKHWRHALMRAVKRKDDINGKQTTRLEQIANAVVEAAIAGDIAAAKEVGDRLDGKALQPLDQHITIGPDESFIDFIRELSARRLAQQAEPRIIDVHREGSGSNTRALASPSSSDD